MSLPLDLCMGSVEAVVDRLALTEVPGEDTPERLVLSSPMMPDAPVGSMRIWTRSDGLNLVYVGMTVPMIKLDSHMMFAFTPADSTVPHFTLDSVGNDDDFAFHLDLIPRLDLGANLAYMDHCYGALTELRAACAEIDGLTKANIGERQWALMSEWMIVHRASEPAFKEIQTTVEGYRDHWASLVENGVPSEILEATPDEIARRDQRNRAAIFDPDVDTVWARVTQLVGEEQSERVRSTLATQGNLL